MFEECSKDRTQPLDDYLIKNIDYLYIESDCNFSKLRNYGRESELMSKPMRHIINAAKDNDWHNKFGQFLTWILII